jgi:putative transcriptional regulator
MENITVGAWLEATELLQGTEFENAAVFMHQYDNNGAVGFVVNRVFNRKLNELAEFAAGKPIALYDGGPVDREHLFVLHRRPELIGNSRHITGPVYYGGDFTKAVQLLNNGQISENDVRIFIGYCGWDKAQLDEEIKEGSWRVGDGVSADLFLISN